MQTSSQTARLTAFTTFLLAMMLALPMSANAAAPGSNLLKNIPVSGPATGGPNAGTFEGKLSIADLSLNEAGNLVASGVLRGNVDGTSVRETFEDIEIQLTQGGTPGECDILFLDVGPIFLDLLGLQVELSQIVLDITAVAGPGNLLGNLLCAVAGLLDNLSLGAFIESILNNILDAINQLL